MPLKNLKTFTHYEVGKAVGCVAVGTIPGGRFVKITTGGLINQPHVTLCQAGDDPDYLSVYDCVDGDVALFYKGGYRNVQVGGASITAGTSLSVGAAGVAVAATAGSQSGTSPFAYTAGTKIVGTLANDTAANGFGGVNLKGPMA